MSIGTLCILHVRHDPRTCYMYARQLGASIELAQHELPHLAVDIFERRDLFIVDVPLVRIRRVPHLICC